jgi:hypothetical protein
MFIHQIFEGTARRIIVTYPGRFQPFHKGHYAVFTNLQAKFGSENVFIITGNKTDGIKSPFNFSDKVRFMHAMGVPDHSIIESDRMYDLPAQFDNLKEQVVFITVVGAPDEKRLNPGNVKKDGSPGYFQRLPDNPNEYVTANQHGYVIVEPEHPEVISIGGQQVDVSHGTPCRELWNQVRDNPQQRAEFIKQLYGRNDPELGIVLDKIPTEAPEPAPSKSPRMTKAEKTPAGPKLKPVKVPKQPQLNEFAPPGGDDGNDGFSDETLKRLAAQWWNGDEDPRIEQTLAAAGWEIGQDEGYNNGGAFVVQAGDVNGNSYISWPAEELEELAEGIVLNKDDLVDIYIHGYVKGQRDKITKKVGANIPNSMVEKYIRAVSDKFNLNHKAFFYTPAHLDEDAAGVGVIASKKQKNDPRYSMSLTKDVRPGQDKKNMKALDLIKEHYDSEPSPVAQAITRRIMVGRTDLLKYGPQAVMAAIDDVADWVGDVDEIGSSDVSGWVAQVERMLKENPPEAFGIDESQVERVHGGPYDRGDADAYYGRRFNPHKMVDNGRGNGGRVPEPLTDPEEIAQYKAGYESGDSGTKDWGESIEETTGEKTKHLVSVTVSDPDSTAVSQRKELRNRRCTVSAVDADQAINTAIAWYRKQGYKVHDHHYVGPKESQGVAEATGDPKFDKMLKGITGKKAVAKQQKTDTKQQARDAFGSMFGGGNPADTLSIRKKGVAEGLEKHGCGHCHGTGRMVRDPDIGTDQECFVCDGTGYVNDEQGVAEGYDSEDLANEVYTEFERIYPNLARKANERTVHAAIMDVLNYGGDSNPSALAQDVARAVKQEMHQGVAEAFSQAAADKNKIKYQKAGRIGHGVGWKEYGDDYSSLVKDIVNKFDNITRLVQYDQAPEPTKYKIVERFLKKYGYPFELFNDVITAIERRVAGETNRYNEQGVAEAAKHGLYYNVNKRKAAGTSRPASSPKAPTAQAWKDAAKTAKSESVAEGGFGRDEEFRNRERNAGLEHETNNIQIYINNRPWKVVAGKGYADSPEERSYLEGMRRWAEKKSAASGKKWTVSLTGATVSEGGGGQQAAIAIAKRESGKYSKKDGHRLKENAERLRIGDPVIITGNVEFEGKTGDIDSFGDGQRFVVVNLYNHGKHSFHSSDVSYNEYADSEEENERMTENDMDESLYQYNQEDPMNSEYAPAAGMGRMTLRGWKQSMARRVAELAKELQANSQDGRIDQDYLWDNVYRKLQSMNLDPIAQEIELAHQELEAMRKRGGIRSRAFKQYAK